MEMNLFSYGKSRRCETTGNVDSRIECAGSTVAGISAFLPKTNRMGGVVTLLDNLRELVKECERIGRGFQVLAQG